MANIREIITEWSMASGTGKVTVMYFGTTPSVAVQRSAINTFWTAVKASLDNSVSFGIRTLGRELDDQTGALTGAWTETSSKTGNGSGTTEQVADATQAIIQWHTGTIINGRFVRGRTFVPGLSIAALSNGNLGASTVTTFQSAANALIASAADLAVWHRPVSGSGGSAPVVNSASVWNELGVLRRRRG